MNSDSKLLKVIIKTYLSKRYKILRHFKQILQNSISGFHPVCQSTERNNNRQNSRSGNTSLAKTSKHYWKRTLQTKAPNITNEYSLTLYSLSNLGQLIISLNLTLSIIMNLKMVIYFS
jgi:hypothetical protein